MSIECPTCGYEGNPPDAEFCETCGAELGNTPPVTPTSSPSSSFTPPTQVIPTPQPLTPPTQVIPTPQPLTPPTQVIPTPQVMTAPMQVTSPSPIGAMATARLIPLFNAPTAEFKIYNSAVIGIFTPGNPVEIDLDSCANSDKVSQHHAEITYENGVWMIKDSSTNGIYIKTLGQAKFGARIMSPTPINSGDTIAFANLVFQFQNP